MIRSKYVLTALIAVVISATMIVIRDNSGERYFSCVGKQNKVKEFNDEVYTFSSYTTLSLEAGGKGKVQFQGYLSQQKKTEKQRWKIDRVLDFTFTRQKDKSFFVIEVLKIMKLPDDLVPDDIFFAMSDITRGKALFGMKKNGQNALIIGDSLQPRLVCVRK